MPSSTSEFAFHDAAAQFHALAEALNSLPALDPIDGEGATADAVNGIIADQRQWESAMAMKASEIAQACQQQHAVDQQLAQAPSVQDVEEAKRRLDEAQGDNAKAQKMNEYEDVKREHDNAVEVHASGTQPTVGTLGGVTVPTALGGHWGSGEAYGGSSSTDPFTGGGGSGGSGDGSSAGAGDTSLSSDTSDAGNQAKPMLGGGQPQMPPMAQQPQAPQMPQGGASPGAGGGAPSMPPMRGATLPKDKDKDKDKGSDPLDDLKTDLSGDAAAGAAGAAAGAAMERGATIQGAHTRADISGLNRPAVGAVGGAQPVPPQGGMMSGPMGAGVPGGGGAGGSKPKPRADIKSSDPKQHGMDSIEDAVEGGILGRTTAEKPDLTPNSSVTEDKERGRWES
ncbi:hypothetical protein [Mycobacterium servetii]|uniref:Uncharacterized protein n=1 Tax=Mycobacterium servetii TaxID=3237418 RepID=A0ABV4BXC4_9MYCO